MKKLPQRTCIGCNEKKDKNKLIRIVKNRNSEISIDVTGKMEGRGTYICNNSECLNKAVKNKRMARIFEIEISNDIYESLRNVISGGGFIG